MVFTTFSGHTEEVSTLAVQHGEHGLASASPAFDHTPCEIRIWRVKSGKCHKVLMLVHVGVTPAVMGPIVFIHVGPDLPPPFRVEHGLLQGRQVPTVSR